MKRSLKFTINSGNNRKLIQIDELFLVYKQAINDLLVIASIKQDITEKDIKSYSSPLSYRYKQCARRQALSIYQTWLKAKKKGNQPTFDGAMVLDERFIEVRQSKNSSFDYWVKIATLAKGKPEIIPFKSYDYANQYFNDWKLVKGGRLKHNGKIWMLTLTFNKDAVEIKKQGSTLGIDIGIKKLIVDSSGNEYGKSIETLMDKIQRKQQGSKAFDRALKERDYYINKTAKELPLNELMMIVIENIKGIKQNTKKERRLSKEFRSKFQRWTYARLIGRVQQLAEVGGVHCQFINPAYTSQTCSQCGFVHKLNRASESFRCRNCGYTADADFNAAVNILRLGLACQLMVGRSTQGNSFL